MRILKTTVIFCLVIGFFSYCIQKTKDYKKENIIAWALSRVDVRLANQTNLSDLLKTGIKGKSSDEKKSPEIVKTTARYAQDDFANQSITISITGATLKTDNTVVASILDKQQIQQKEVINGSVSVFIRVLDKGKKVDIGFNGETGSETDSNISFSIMFKPESFTDIASASPTPIKVRSKDLLNLKNLKSVQDVGASVKPIAGIGGFESADIKTVTPSAAKVDAVKQVDRIYITEPLTTRNSLDTTHIPTSGPYNGMLKGRPISFRTPGVSTSDDLLSKVAESLSTYAGVAVVRKIPGATDNDRDIILTSRTAGNRLDYGVSLGSTSGTSPTLSFGAENVTPNVVAKDAVAQVSTITYKGSLTSKSGSLKVKIDGKSFTAPFSTDESTTLGNLVSSINADAKYTATVSGKVITITAATAGTPFNISLISGFALGGNS